jgi:hypothetical protein
MADIKYLVVVDAQGAVKSIKDFEGAIDGAGDASAKAEPKHQSLWKQVALGEIAYNAVRKAASFLVDQGKDCVKDAEDQEQADKDLSAALEQTGRSVDGNLQHYLDFAKAQQLVTKYRDEEIEGAQSLLLQYLNLDQNGIDKAMKGTMGLASVMKLDLQGAAMMVTRAINNDADSIGRMKIHVDESLPPMQKQAAILDQLEKLYGRSTSEVDTFGGRVGLLTKALGEAKETIGGVVVNNEALNKVIKECTGYINDLNTSGKLDEWARGVAGAFVGVGKVVALSVEGIVLTWDQAESVLFAGMAQAIQNIKPILMSMYAVMAAAPFGAMKKGAAELGGVITDLTTIQKSYVDSSDSLNEKTLDVHTTFDGFIKILDDAEAAFKTTGTAAQTGGGGVKGFGKDAGDAAKQLEALKKDLGFTFTTDVEARIARIDQALKLYGKSMPYSDVQKLRMEQAKLTDELMTGGLGWDWVTQAEQKNIAVIPLHANLLETQIGRMWYLNAALKAVGVTAADPKDMKQWESNVQGAIQNIFNALNGLMSGMSQINANALQTTLDNLQTEYDARVAYIKATITDADTQSYAIAELDKEYAAKKTKIKRDAAVKEKELAIAEAISGVAQAIIAAWKLPPPFNIIAAAAAAAMGAMEVAVIESQPIPLAGGAVFKQPTEFMTTGGTRYQAGETGVEIMATESMIRRIVREETGGAGAAAGTRAGASAGGRPTTLTIPIYLGTKKIGEEVLSIVQGGIDLNKLEIRSRNIRPN